MAGIYIHIPFCKKACHYCDFHFSTSVQAQVDLVKCLIKEIELQKDYLNGETVETIYFGGGTPSLLKPHEFDQLFNAIHSMFDVSDVKEITIETNPDDISVELLKQLKILKVNRLSIGVQTFDESILRWMNRAHSATQSLASIQLAQEAGFSNITIDLIYGIPVGSHDIWKKDIEKALSVGVPHISAYNLTIEEGTAFGNWKRKGKLNEVADEYAVSQFEYLINILEANGFSHYEISNFGKEGYYSNHNSSYWNGKKYLGIGPSAHSYNGVSRQFNVANNNAYIKKINANLIPFEIEILSLQEKLNDYLLTRLRTKWGADLSTMKAMGEVDWNEFNHTMSNLIQKGYLIKSGDVICLTKTGKFLADRIISDLFFV